MPEPPLLTVAEVAARLCLSPQAVRARLRAGALPGVKLGHTWRVRQADLAGHHRLTILAEAGAVLAASLDADITFAAIGRLVVPALADYCLVDLLGEGPALIRVVAAHAAPVPDDQIEVLRRHPPRLDNPHAVIGGVVRSGQPLVLPDAPPDLFARLTEDAEHLAARRALAPSSLLIQPLRARGRTLGAMTLARVTPGWHFGPDQVVLVEQLAGQVALAIDNARLYAAEQRLAFLVEAGTTLATSLDYAATLDRIAHLTIPVLADSCIIDEVAPDQAVRCVALIHRDPALAAVLREMRQRYQPDRDRDAGHPVIRAIQAGAPVVTAAVTDEAWQRAARDEGHLALLRALGDCTHMAVPLVAHGRTVGVLSLACGQSGRHYTADDQALAEELAARAALAIDNAHRHQAEQAARARLALLAEAGAALAASLDVAATLATVTRLVVPRLADWAVVWWRAGAPGEAPTLRPVAPRHRDPAREPTLAALHRYVGELAGPETGVGRVLGTGRPDLAAEMGEADWRIIARDAEHLRLLRALAPRSHLMLPLAARGQVLGVLALVLAESGRRFGPDDLALGEELAARAALALDNARLHEEAQAALRARDTFLSIASHELRTPVTSIKGFLQILLRQQERGQIDTTQLARTLPVIHRSTDRLAVLIQDLLDVSRIRFGRLLLHVTAVDPAELARLVVERYRLQAGEGRALTLTVAGTPPAIRADPDRLDQVLSNVLDNALKYSPGGGPIAATVAGDGVGVRLSVRDAGIGLPAGSEEAIFEPFGRAANVSGRQIAGLGLGLYICRSIVGQHGGRVWAESAGEGQGTTLHVWLPTDAGASGATGRPEPVADAPPSRESSTGH